MKSIYIYGASGHGLVVADVAKACGYNNIIFIDDGDNSYKCFEDIQYLNNIPMALGIGDNNIREKLFYKAINYGFELVSLIHPSSSISSSSFLGLGTVIMPNVVVNSKVKIGNAVILNSSSVCEHECVIDDFTHISPSVSLAGNVKIGRCTHIGIGSCIIQGLTVGSNCLIGAGSVVVNNFCDNIKAYGNPCKKIEEINE